MNPKIKFGIVGCGHIGKRHMEMIARHPNAELIAFCDIKKKNDLDIEMYKDAVFYESLDLMLLNHQELDVVCIATPNGSHAEHSLKILLSGKNIVVENPLALSTADCGKIVHAALQCNKHVFCVMQNRYSPPSVWIKELVNEGVLGKIYLVQINCFWNRDDRYYKKGSWKGTKELDGGTLFTQFSHFIDIMFWVFGDINNIEAKFADFNHRESTSFEDSGIVSFEFMRGGMGSLNYSTSVWDKNMESSITVIAENGTIKIGGQYMNKIEYCHVKNYTMPELPPANPANDYGPYKGSAANHNFVIDNVVNVLLNGSVITTNAMEGLKVVDIIERIYKCKPNNF